MKKLTKKLSFIGLLKDVQKGMKLHIIFDINSNDKKYNIKTIKRYFKFSLLCMWMIDKRIIIKEAIPIYSLVSQYHIFTYEIVAGKIDVIKYKNFVYIEKWFNIPNFLAPSK